MFLTINTQNSEVEHLHKFEQAFPCRSRPYLCWWSLWNPHVRKLVLKAAAAAAAKTKQEICIHYVHVQMDDLDLIF